MSGDTLWDLAGKYLGDPTRWTEIYDANQLVIEAAARSHGHATSDHGNLIFPGSHIAVPGGACVTPTQQPTSLTPPEECDHGVQIVYVPGYNDKTDGEWATAPLRQKLKDKGVPVLNSGPDKVPYLALEGDGRFDRESVADGREKLLAHLKDKVPSDACIALIGYSEGVLAIEQALHEVSSQIGTRIVTVELLADPKVIAGLAGGEPGIDPDFTNRVFSICDDTDPLCTNKGWISPAQKRECTRSPFSPGDCFVPGHLTTAYGEEAERAAEWAASRYEGTAEGR